MTRLIHRIIPGVAPLLMALVALSPAPALADDHSSSPRRMMRAASDPPRVDLPESEVVLPLLDWGNRPTVELTINGTGPHRFILDTGAMGSVIDAGLVEELGLPEIGKQMIGSPAGVPQEVPRVAMKEVRLEGIVIHDMKAAVMDLAGMFKSSGAPRGVLSARIFSGSLLAIDYPGRKILIRPGELGPADGSRIFQYDESDGLPTVTLVVAGTEIKAHLDTGSPSTFSLPGHYMESLPLKSEPVFRGRARLVDAEIELFGAPLKGALRVGEYTFEDPEILFAEGFPSGNLGYGFLGQFTVTLDFKNRRVRLDRAEDAVRTASASGPVRVMRKAGGPGGTPTVMRRMAPGGAPPRRYGVMFPGIDGNPLVVDGVDPGSVAEAAGLMAGDIILKMNDRPVEDLTRQERIGMLRASPLTLAVGRGDRTLTVEMTLPE